MKLAVYNHGPVTVALDASNPSFTFYSHGVYDEPKCGNGINDMDHQVLVVGWTKLGDVDCWIVKNSWSTHWGNDGYIYMKIEDNVCGVMTCATYPLVTKCNS